MRSASGLGAGPPATAPALIVGHGLIGAAVRDCLAGAGIPVVCVGRRAGVPGCRAHDLVTPDGRAEFEATLEEVAPGCAVLAHGPGDVTWIEANETRAAEAHCGAAAIVARSGVAAILVSTDNVFPGHRGGYAEHDRAGPGNAYGRIKARAEQEILAGRALVLRVSLVYGWAARGQRSTFAQRCLDAAAARRPMSAPVDQVFTPIHVRDVSTVIAALCRRPGQITGVRHLAGPAQLSRYEFAQTAYALSGSDPSLVRPCRRQDTEWACRPRFSSLACGSFAELAELTEWQPMTPAAGLGQMLAARPGAAALP